MWTWQQGWATCACSAISAGTLFGSGELEAVGKTQGWWDKNGVDRAAGRLVSWYITCCLGTGWHQWDQTLGQFKPTLWLRGVAGGDWGMEGKEVRWLQAEQVPLRPLASKGCNGCFVSRTWTSAGHKDAWQSCQMNEAWQAWRWGWKSGPSSQKQGICQVQSGYRTTNRIAVHPIFLTNLVFTAISYVCIVAVFYVL